MSIYAREAMQRFSIREIVETLAERIEDHEREDADLRDALDDARSEVARLKDEVAELTTELEERKP